MLESRPGRPVGPIFDPLILDRQGERYRSGRGAFADACRAHHAVLREARDALSGAIP
ncbi:MAG TPA: hypothetical protein VMV23_07305 [Candidatus Nanopelagicaceae bacterium]|nr:hypothetical protein [Candidatus Nanopelagicaceae bacterium]